MLLLHRKILNLHKIHKTKKILGLDIKRKYDQQENFEYNEVSKKISPNLSSFNCDEILLKQYMNRGEDYMWVKGVK